MILNNLIFVKDTSTLSDIITDYNSDNYNKTIKNQQIFIIAFG